MARYWVGGTGTWDATTTTNWSATSGGAGGVSAPTAADDVIFDANSGGLTVTVASGAVANNLNATGFTGSITGVTITLNGTTVTLGSGMTATGFIASLQPGAGNTVTFTSNGRTVNSLNVINGTLSLADAMTMSGTLTHAAGNFVTNNFSFTAAGYSSNVSTTRTITLGSSSVTITGGNNAWLVGVTGLTNTANTATITMTNSLGGFNQVGGSVNGTSLVWTGATDANIANAVSGITNLTITGSASTLAKFTLVGTVTLTGTFTINGNSVTNRIILQSTAVGTPRTISAATVVASNLDVMDITGAGAGSWDLSAITGLSGDAGGNSGITFTPAVTCYARGLVTASATYSWSTANIWANVSGGTAASQRIPLPQDNVRFDVNTFSASGITVISTMPRLGKDIDWTGATNSPTWQNNASFTTSFFGSVTLISGMAFLNNTQGQNAAGRGNHTLTSAGKTWANTLQISAPGATYTLADAWSGGAGLTLNNGTLNTNGMAVSCTVFTSTSTGTRSLILGTSTVSLTQAVSGFPSWNVTASGMTMSAASATLVLSTTATGQRNFTGGGFTYGTLTYTVPGSIGSLFITDANTFTTLNFSGAAKNLILPISATVTVTNWNVFGLVGAVVTIKSGFAGTAATISKASGYIASDYVSVQDITGAATGATYYMGSRSTSVSGNTGLSFTDAPQRYWVGGTGNIDGVTTASWAVVSGGTGGVAYPGTSDSVFLDGNSGAGTVTVTVAPTWLNFDATGYTGTYNGNGLFTTVTGTTCTFGTTMTAGASMAFALNPTAGVSTALMTNGKVLSSFQVNGASTGTVAQQDVLNVTNAINLTQGTWATNNFSVTCGTFTASNSNTRTLTMGSSVLTFTGAATAWNTAINTGLTVTTNTAILTFTGASAIYSSANITFNGTSIVFSGSGASSSSASVFQNFTRTGTAAKTDSHTFTSGTATVVNGTFTANGNSVTNRMLVQSNAVGTSRTITAAVVSTSNADFMDITGAGAASWNLSAATGGSGDAGGNSGITFTAAQTNYWIGNGSNWSSVGKWASTSGGVGSTGRVPLPQDTARFDANSFTSAGQTVTMDMPRQAKDIDFTGALNNPTWTFSVASIIYGSLTLVSGMTWTAGSLALSFAGRGTHTITSAGRSSSVIATINSVGGSYTLQDAFATGNGITLSAGTFDTGSMALTGSTFTSTGSTTRALTLGTSTVSLTATTSVVVWNVAATGLTLSAASSTIVLATASSVSRFFGSTGGPQTYGTLTYTVAASTGALSITNASQTFGTLNVSGGARTLLLLSGGTTTVTNWNVFGLVGAVVTVNSSTAASAATISKTSGYIASDYVSVQDITGTGGATFYMGSRSTNVSGNTGLTFTDAPQRYWVGGAATWDATVGTKWAVVSGGTGGLAVPTNADDVYLDANSGAGTVTTGTSYSAVCKNLVMAGFTGATAQNSGSTVNASGTVITLSATMTGNLQWTIGCVYPTTGATVTLTSNGKSIAWLSLSQNSGTTLALADALSVQTTLSHNAGTFTTNNFAVTCGTYSSSNTNTRTLTLGSSAITVTSGASGAWSTSTATGLTITANTAVVTFTGPSSVTLFSSASSVNYNGLSLVLSASGQPIVSAAGCTFANLTRTGTVTKTDSLVLAGNVTTTGAFTVNGNSATNRVQVQSTTVGLTRTITAAAVTGSNFDLMDITGAGAANWDLSAITGGSGDAGGNSGITFTTPVTAYWVSDTGNWSDVTKWRTTSGGATQSRVPLAQDTVRFDANSFTLANQTVTSDMPRIGKDIDWTGTPAVNRTWSFASMAVTIFGSVTLNSAAGLLLSGTFSSTFAGRGTHTIATAGNIWTNGWTLSATGAYSLSDTYTSTVGLTVAGGTFTTNNFNFTGTSLNPGGGSLARTLNLGTSTITMSGTGGGAWSMNGATNLTVNGSASTFIFTGAVPAWNGSAAISGTGFGTLTWASSVTGVVGMVGVGANYAIQAINFIGSGTAELQIQNTFTIGTLSVSPGRKLRLPQIVTTTVTNWNVSGTAGNLVTVYSSASGIQALLAKSNSNPIGSDYLSIQDVAASPGSTWYAGTHSVDGGNNTGWTFSDPFISSSTASLTLSASGAVLAPITATAALALLATNTALVAPASGTASVVLTGTVAAKVTATGTASVVLVASGTAKAPVTGAAAMVLLTAPATARASVTSTTAALTITAATATAFAPIAPAAALVLTAVNAAVQAKLSANATLLLVASVVTGYLGRRDVQVAFGTPLNKVVAGVPVLYLITTGVPSI